ncbi:hypothetical protein BJI67_01475 [Acidihalobacter aeolianus]|uniref:Porin domain-containing protein n=1 Tax=Acidihalobacter aeolianus TaxID=2792603 RepID=A0A1D8K4M4_9GAMM|nr:porin [Acidihalobacter aeolianus]AOV15918.1 hypothetical protein BJI67_01475 [Acidihalobacter aeolianus]
MNVKNVFKPKVAALAAAMGLAFAGTAAHAAPTASLFGAIGIVGAYDSPYTQGGQNSWYVSNDASRLGVKGNLGTYDGTTYIYNYTSNIDPVNESGGLSTYIGYLGAKGAWGTFKFGRPLNPFYNAIGATFNPFWWFFTDNTGTRGTDNSIIYTTPTMSGFQASIGIEHIGKGSSSGDKSTADTTLAATYATGPFSFAAAFASYSKYADGSTAYSSAADYNVYGTGASNTYSGEVLKSKAAVSGTYSQGPFSVSLGFFSYKPYNSGTQNEKDITSVNILGSYNFMPKWTVMADFSTTSQSSSSYGIAHKGSFTTLSLAYTPVDPVGLFVEYQYADKKAVQSQLDGIYYGNATKAFGELAIGGYYSF